MMGTAFCCDKKGELATCCNTCGKNVQGRIYGTLVHAGLMARAWKAPCIGRTYQTTLTSLLAGVGKMCWLLDFTSYSLSNAPPLKVSITCNNILQNHYPERLGLAVCWHAPTLFSMTWKVCYK